MKQLLVVGFMLFISQVAMAGCEQSSTDLKKSNSVICTDHNGTGTVNFALNAMSTFDMYLSYEALTNCDTHPTYYWEVLDNDGTVASSRVVTQIDDIHVTAGNSFRLRVDLGDISECTYYGLDFGLETI